MAEVVRRFRLFCFTRRYFSSSSKNVQQGATCILRTCRSTQNRNINEIASVFSTGKQQTRCNSSSQTTPNPADPVHSVVQRLHELEEKMRVKGYSLLRWGLGAIIVMVTTLYFFREEVRENVADEVAVVATKSLEDENVVYRVHEMTKVVLQDIINDPETSKLASKFVMSVLNRDDVRNSAIDLTLYVLKDPKTNEKVSHLAAATVKNLMNQDEMRNLLLEYIKMLILDPNTQQACTAMLKTLLEDPQLKAFMAESLGSLVASAVVTNKAVELGKNVTHQVVSDETIQRETSNALWKVVKESITPGWFGSKKDNEIEHVENENSDFEN